ncbi:2-hydroxychromene-2-carboxylate isomerase [Insolitispirillum peregrinum]|uniref:2-hydroxychromene-2-carboxylate isomerase n=1 Tax=Insolitispirillum peregrinum TaxID=80876 RepID=A0A1N7MJF0_9PROT|nr:2-hydroxychromene-2-carboxylate isomerase [Insolitispirillum peregrinum]SIS86275.1 2-hydroxychromene-2-carboxylate isomerase [Insolitispirillum peregrinum]
MAKKTPIEFWFDFSSPYGYIAATQIDNIAEDHGRTVLWRPFLLGAVMKESGGAPLASSAMKFSYMKTDVERFCRLYGITYRQPETFPIGAVAASRAFYWLEEHAPAKAVDFAAVVYSAYFEQGKNIGEPEVVLDIAARMGIDRAALEQALADPVIKNRLREVCDEAVSRGIFGSPWLVVDGEHFWGADRLWMVEEWLETGGW